MRETVLIVHGTFAAPLEDALRWYAPRSAFCRELDAQLAARGSTAPCWAHLEECGEELRRLADRATEYFAWSGENAWLDRSIAARELRAEMQRLSERGWQWHLVAHSHGGNVVLEALDFETAHGGLTGNVVLLGTPILVPPRRKSWMDTVWAFEATTTPSPWLSWWEDAVRPERVSGPVRLGVAIAASLTLWVILAGTGLRLAGLGPGALAVGSLWATLFGIATVIALSILYWSMRRFMAESVALFLGFPAVRELLTVYAPRVLFINSDKDEAFNFLAGVLSGANPFQAAAPSHRMLSIAWLRSFAGRAVEIGRGRYPWAHWRTSLGLAAIAAAGAAALMWMAAPGSEMPWATRLLPWSLLLAALAVAIAPGRIVGALIVPWRLIEGAALCGAVIARSVALQQARRRAWEVLQALALGLSGSPMRPGEMSVLLRPDPDFAGGAFLYEPLRETAEKHAVSERSRSMREGWGHFTSLPDSEQWRFDRWSEVIRDLATDPQLVHTVYYRHPDAVAQIASHLARKGEDLLTERMRRQQEASAEGPLRGDFT